MDGEITTDHTPLMAEPPRLRRPWWVIPALLVALAVVAILGIGLQRRMEGQVKHGLAPDFTLTTYDGQTIRLAEMRGTPIVLNIWASWCVPCRTEAPLLEQASQQYRGRVQFLGVAYIDNEKNARQFLDEYGITYPNGPDLGGRISDRYRVRGVPETFFIGADGEIKEVKIGPLLGRAELDRILGQLLE